MHIYIYIYTHHHIMQCTHTLRRSSPTLQPNTTCTDVRLRQQHSRKSKALHVLLFTIVVIVCAHCLNCSYLFNVCLCVGKLFSNNWETIKCCD